MRGLMLLLSLSLWPAVVSATTAPPTETEKLVALGRLYGVVRWFHPTDAAQELDWNRFAVHAVRSVRAADSAADLDRTLEALFAPVGAGILIADVLPPEKKRETSADPRLVAWRHRGLGFGGASPRPGGGGAYSSARTQRAAPEVASNAIDAFVTLMQTWPAEELRGKTVRFAAQVKAERPVDAGGGAALWLRVDRAARQVGFFDNMQDRPIVVPEWREYAVEGKVDADASSIAFGMMTGGRTRAGFDSVRLTVREEDGSWRALPIPQPGFEEEGGWQRAGNSRNAVVTYPTDAPPEGQRWLSLALPDPAAAATPSSAPKALFEAPIEAGAHVDVDLGAGLRARVPLVLEDSEAAVSDAQKAALESLKAELARLPEVGDAAHPDTRAADVIVAWSVFRHFYPYWPEVEVDWDAALPALFEDAGRAQSRDAHADSLRRLVARVRDGHGRVNDPRASQKMGLLPLNLRWLDKRLVVMASAVPEQVAVGDVITAIDGRPAAACFAESEALRSGSPQWRAASAIGPLLTGPEGSHVSLDIERASGAMKVELAREKREPVRESRPEAVVELLSPLRPGVWYVDLTRAKWADVEAKLEEIAKARAVVFDVRGYPTDGGSKILAHLVPVPDQDRWMHVPQIVEPFGRVASWHDIGWNLQPQSPTLSGKIAFLTDGRAISYAESVMGYVEDWKLGTIVGSPTAGTNGNVNMFTVPSGLRISFTGLKVTRHDGSVFHLRGAVPTVPVEPTLAGIRAGKDEVLERALEVVSTP